MVSKSGFKKILLDYLEFFYPIIFSLIITCRQVKNKYSRYPAFHPRKIKIKLS